MLALIGNHGEIRGQRCCCGATCWTRRYRHEAFPPKAFITVARTISDAVMEALNAVPIDSLVGAEYFPSETIIWTTYEK